MSKRIYTTSFTALALIAGLSVATPSYAQLGGVTGAVNGSLNSSMRSTTDLSTRTRARATTRAKVKAPEIRPEIRTEAPRTNVNARTGSPVVVYGTTRSGGYHSHGYYGRHTHTHGHAHYYEWTAMFWSLPCHKPPAKSRSARAIANKRATHILVTGFAINVRASKTLSPHTLPKSSLVGRGFFYFKRRMTEERLTPNPSQSFL